MPRMLSMDSCLRRDDNLNGRKKASRKRGFFISAVGLTRSEGQTQVLT